MQDFPHTYHATADAVAEGDIQVSSLGLPVLRTASPAEFGGPGDRWSPETLLSAAVADCFILTFRAVARASKLPWEGLHVEVDGTLERPEKVTQFTGFTLTARLDVPEGVDPAVAERALEKAERNCLISNSLKGAVHLHAHVHVEPRQPAFG